MSQISEYCENSKNRKLDNQVKKEIIVVTMTTWKDRIDNIPVVLDSIYAQTCPPDVVVLNLAYDEVIPGHVQEYIDAHGVEVFRIEDTKVYKKLIPTLKRYPTACVINIDDWIYPENMIADFMSVHKRFPAYPISGNNVVYEHIGCHCGCASLTKLEYFGGYLDLVDAKLIAACPSDDLVFTYFAAKAGYYYLRTKELYFLNMKSLSTTGGYSERFSDPLGTTWSYLTSNFGEVPQRNFIRYFVVTAVRKLRLIWETRKVKSTK